MVNKILSELKKDAGKDEQSFFPASFVRKFSGGNSFGKFARLLKKKQEIQREHRINNLSESVDFSVIK